MKRVLMILYYFPPCGGGGVQRSSKFVKYLTRLGWQPIVLTVRERVYRSAGYPIDYSLLEDIPRSAIVVRNNCIDLNKLSRKILSEEKVELIKPFFERLKHLMRKILKSVGYLIVNPDPQFLWIPIAVVVGYRLLKKYGIKVVYSSGNPWSAHLVGVLLKMIARVRLVVDYRDGWTLCSYRNYKDNKLREYIHRYLETKVINNADVVCLATDVMHRDYVRVFSKVDSRKFLIIYNGFDREDFLNVIPHVDTKFTITYCGSIYSYRSPRYFLQALASWRNEAPWLNEKVRVNFIGICDEESQTLIRQLKLNSIVKLMGYLPHRECIRYLLGSDVLLLLIDDRPESKFVLTGKFFEYIATGRPILALIPTHSEAAEIIGREGIGYIVPPTDVTKIKNKLKSLYSQKLHEGVVLSSNYNLIYKYSREASAQTLSSILQKLT